MGEMARVKNEKSDITRVYERDSLLWSYANEALYPACTSRFYPTLDVVFPSCIHYIYTSLMLFFAFYLSSLPTHTHIYVYDGCSCTGWNAFCTLLWKVSFDKSAELTTYVQLIRVVNEVEQILDTWFFRHAYRKFRVQPSNQSSMREKGLAYKRLLCVTGSQWNQKNIHYLF